MLDTGDVTALKYVLLITDGACIKNPGPGGWAFILRYGLHTKEQSGGEPATTNNRMEIQAAIEGLKALREPCVVKLVSDSRYLIDGITTWRHAWKRSGWVKHKGQKPVPNADLWQALDELLDVHTVDCEWIRGHSGHPDNERCDALATKRAEEQRPVTQDKLPSVRASH